MQISYGCYDHRRRAFSFRAAFTWNATGTRAFLLSTPEGNRSPEPHSRDPFRRLGSFLIPAVTS